MLYENIKKLVEYGIQSGLTPESERVYTTNLLLDLFHEDNYEDLPVDTSSPDLENILGALLDEAVQRGLLEDSIVYRDLFDTRLMNCLLPRPSQVQKTFWEKYAASPEEATGYYYKFSQDTSFLSIEEPWVEGHRQICAVLSVSAAAGMKGVAVAEKSLPFF